MLVDQGAEADQFNTLRAPINMHLGAGHDYSTGILLNEGGDDTYVLANLAGGAANCVGSGLFVDSMGDDSYTAASMRTLGAADKDVPGCPGRTSTTLAIMIDGDGTDSYTVPGTSDAAESSIWLNSVTASPTELGVGVDGAGTTGF